MIDLQVSQTGDGFYEVFCQISEGYTDYEIFEALMAAAYRFAEDSDLVDEPTLH